MEKRNAELFGELNLVGTRGKCCAILTERQLTIERFDGKGLRLDLAAIDRMRHLKVPMLPSGTYLLGGIAIYLGITTIMSPLSWVSIGVGFTAIVSNFISRYSILAIETGSGGRHLVSGSEGNLLKLCLMVDRVRHGSDLEEARIGLEELETGLPTFPSIRDAKGILATPDKKSKTNMGMLGLPSGMASIEAFEVDTIMDQVPLESVADNRNERLPDSPSISDFSGPAVAQNEQNSLNAYERAWGVDSTPSWYKEREIAQAPENRIDSALSDASQGMDLFAPGGIFDAATPSEIDEFRENGNSDSGVLGDLFDSTEQRERELSSSQMIKQAHNSFGAPEQPYVRPMLPPPTDEAVREECRAGVVRRARAKQELRLNNMTEAPIKPANLEEYPALSKLANSMGTTRLSVNMADSKKPSSGWLGRLLRPSGGMVVREENRGVSNQKSEVVSDEKPRFQSSQHMRLRSDQEHQAEVGARIRGMRNSAEYSSAKDTLDSIVSRIQSGEEEAPRLMEAPSNSLRFGQLRPTSSKDDPHPLPGLRRLG